MLALRLGSGASTEREPLHESSKADTTDNARGDDDTAQETAGRQCESDGQREARRGRREERGACAPEERAQESVLALIRHEAGRNPRNRGEHRLPGLPPSAFWSGVGPRTKPR